MTNRLTYAIDSNGPYDENELRTKLREHRREHGEEATMTLTVVEMTEGGTTGRRVDVGQFLPPVFRVDFHSEPGWGDDEARLSELRAAVEDSTLARPSVKVEPERNEVVVEFDVEARGLGDATDVGRTELRRVLDEAGIDFRSTLDGSTGSSGWF